MSTKTIPEQLTDALAQISTLTTDLATANTTLATVRGELATANTNLEAARGQVTTLTTEKAQLTTQLTEANGKITAHVAEIGKLTKERNDLAAKEQDLEKRADARAKEIIAAVGQTPPVAAKPNAGAANADKPQLSTLESVAANYREKYGIS